MLVAHNRVHPRHHATTRIHCDRIGIVGFNDRAHRIANLAEPHDALLLKRTQQLHEYTGGLTNITAGLRLSIEMLEAVPRGTLRRIWLLSDGEPNIDAGEKLDHMVLRARQSYININTIGFGVRPYGSVSNWLLSIVGFGYNHDEGILRRIARGTHNGRFVSVSSLRELSNTLTSNNGAPARLCGRRSEATVLAIDLSASMKERMEGRRKVHVVEEACLHLLRYKQELYGQHQSTTQHCHITSQHTPGVTCRNSRT